MVGSDGGGGRSPRRINVVGRIRRCEMDEGGFVTVISRMCGGDDPS